MVFWLITFKICSPVCVCVCMCVCVFDVSVSYNYVFEGGVRVNVYYLGFHSCICVREVSASGASCRVSDDL